jgi:hypothetical protein
MVVELALLLRWLLESRSGISRASLGIAAPSLRYVRPERQLGPIAVG